MQLLLDYSEEFEKTAGLSIIQGKVKKFTKKELGIENIPHIGWNKIYKNKKVRKNLFFAILQTITLCILFIHILFYPIMRKKRNVIYRLWKPQILFIFMS